jgi:YD repeat-containing protein
MTAVDEAITYDYDLNDRLLTELKDVAGWADDRLTVYGYDDTQQVSKSVHRYEDEEDEDLTASDPTVEQTDYTYNLQGRMRSADVKQYDPAEQLVSHNKSTYEYDDSGIRVAKTDFEDVNNDGDFDDTGTDTTARTDYHVDHRNPTGYAQVLEEMQGDTVVKSYTIGHDVFFEAVRNSYAARLLKDGHGSTRALVDALGNVITSGSTPQVYAYDAFGPPSAST